MVDGSNQDFEQNPYVLHVTVASTYNTQYFNDTMKFISDKFLKRNNSDNDIWLIGIDIPEGDRENHDMYKK